MYFSRMTDGDDESMYFAHDERNVKQVVIWHETFGMKAFSDEEFEKTYGICEVFDKFERIKEEGPLRTPPLLISFEAIFGI